MKTSAFRRALVVPAVLLIGFGGTALAATPAFADPSPTVTADPTATPTPTADPTATATPTATPAATATSTATPTPAAPSPAATTAPTKLTVTSPNLNQNSIAIHNTRTLTLTGTAPTGSVIALYDDYEGERLTALRTTSTSFTLSYTFAADAPYDQLLEVKGTLGTKTIGDTQFEVLLDAATSATPTLDAPTSGSSYVKGLLPFNLSVLAKPVTFSGTGTPGDDILLDFEGSDENATDIFHGGGLQTDEIVVDDDGTWTGSGFLLYGDTTVTASQVQLGGTDSDDPVTQQSDSTDPISLTTTLPAGTVLPPTITKPNVSDDDDEGDGSGITIEDNTALDLIRPSSSLTDPATAGAERRSQLRAEVRGKAAPSADRFSPRDDTTGDGSADDPNADVADYGIQVKGTPSQDAPGFLTTTVAGTGTPGDGVVLSLVTAKSAQSYFTKLYPALFAAFDTSSTSSDASIPTLPDDPGTVTALLPTDDHSITVGADGKWSTTVTLKPGQYYFSAFTTAPAAATDPTYSVAAGLLPVNLTGTPLVAPADDGTQLAFTGSNSGPLVGIALAALTAGGSLLFLSRRRRA